jgi:hypothetical protein
MVRRERKIE